MKTLEIINKRVATTAREKVGNAEIYYQYETDEQVAVPQSVNFSTQNNNGKQLSGTYSVGGGFNLNGQGITDPEDFEIMQKAFATILEIVKPAETEEVE